MNQGWKGVPPGQPTRHHSLAELWGQAALLGLKQVDFVSMDPAGSLWDVHCMQPYKVGTYNQLCLRDFCRVQDALLLFLPPELSQGQHTGPMSPSAGLVPPRGCCADGSGHSKAHTRHILAAPDPDGACMLSQERETWAPAAAVPNERCFSPFHYMAFLIKTERGFFFRK